MIPMQAASQKQHLSLTKKRCTKGKKAIKDWIEKANQQFKIKMEPTKYSGSNSTAILTAVVSGNFNGSPVALNYHMEIKENEITRVEITATSAE